MLGAFKLYVLAIGLRRRGYLLTIHLIFTGANIVIQRQRVNNF